jgi:hypothetical protein
MVIATARVVVLVALAAGAGDDADAAVRSALRRGDYPWYDAPADAVRPVEPPPEAERPAPEEAGQDAGGAGPTIVFALMSLALATVIALMTWSWARRRPDPDAATGRARPAGVSARARDLPPGLPAGLSDPLAEAARLRALGDHAGAVVCLFAHQLRALERLGLIRPAPGRTARQLVRDVAEARLRRLVEPTLRLFEAAYYGHQAPSPEALDVAWSAAEELERRLAAGVAP